MRTFPRASSHARPANRYTAAESPRLTGASRLVGDGGRPHTKHGLFDHLDLRVHDLTSARRFYDVFLPALGFGPAYPTRIGIAYDAVRDHPKPEFLGFIEDRAHRPNATRLAFWADSIADMDRIAAVAHTAGALNLKGPEYCPQYTPTYYAAYFEDPSGSRLEVCFRLAPPRAAMQTPSQGA